MPASPVSSSYLGRMWVARTRSPCRTTPRWPTSSNIYLTPDQPRPLVKHSRRVYTPLLVSSPPLPVPLHHVKLWHRRRWRISQLRRPHRLGRPVAQGERRGPRPPRRIKAVVGCTGTGAQAPRRPLSLGSAPTQIRRPIPTPPVASPPRQRWVLMPAPAQISCRRTPELKGRALPRS
jgi:hypothetical protein